MKYQYFVYMLCLSLCTLVVYLQMLHLFLNYLHTVYIKAHWCTYITIFSPALSFALSLSRGSKALSVTAPRRVLTPQSVGISCTAWPKDSQETPLSFCHTHNIGLFTASLPAWLHVWLQNAALQLPFTYLRQNPSRQHERPHCLTAEASGKPVKLK